MRFYISTGGMNAGRAIELSEILKSRGHELTYDWMAHGDVRREGEIRMGEVAFNELRAVRDAELVIALLPGGAGTHTELGQAIATRGNKRIIIWSETGSEFSPDERTCVFYFHPCCERVVCPFDELLRRLDTEQIGSDITRIHEE
ncbi:MAG: hypothetical protein IKG85_06795 [Clostridia bacterium]|nr:hypothetical protein [Clostridia bacterium]